MNISLNGIDLGPLRDSKEIDVVFDMPEYRCIGGGELETLHSHDGLKYVVECMAKPFKWTYYTGQTRFPRKKKKAFKKEMGIDKFIFNAVRY